MMLFQRRLLRELLSFHMVALLLGTVICRDLLFICGVFMCGGVRCLEQSAQLLLGKQRLLLSRGVWIAQQAKNDRYGKKEIPCTADHRTAGHRHGCLPQPRRGGCASFLEHSAKLIKKV